MVPVGWLESEENTELENVGLVPDDDDVEIELSVGGGDVLVGFPAANDDATLEMSELPCPGLKPVACGCSPVGEDDPCWFPWVLPSASSINVGTLGTGGAGADGWPNGFLEPVWCVLTALISEPGGGLLAPVKGTDDERGNALVFAGCARGDATWLLLRKEGNGFDGAFELVGDVDVCWVPSDRAVPKLGKGLDPCC